MNSQIRITGNLDKIWFASDHHFGHKNIIEYCNRPFETVKEMDTILINHWNAFIEPGNTIYYLSDFCLGGKEMARLYFNQLNGHIKVLSNPWHHDSRWLGGSYRSKDGILVDYLSPLVSLKVKKPERKSVYIMLCHYPLASWDRQHYGAIHLHGHCHGNILSDSFRMDVGVDAQDYYPVSLKSILGMAEK